MYIITVAINIFCAKRGVRLTKEYSELKKERVKTTTECLANIKLLKLHSWTEVFAETIKGKRAKELDALWKIYSNRRIIITSLAFFPAILSPIVFALYITSGKSVENSGL